MQTTIFRFKFNIRSDKEYIYPNDSLYFSITAPWSTKHLRAPLCDFSLSSQVRLNDSTEGYTYTDIDDFCEKNNISGWRSYINGVYGFMDIFDLAPENDNDSAIIPQYLLRDSRFDGVASVVWFDGGVPKDILTKFLVRPFVMTGLINFITLPSARFDNNGDGQVKSDEWSEVALSITPNVVGPLPETLYTVKNHRFKRVISVESTGSSGETREAYRGDVDAVYFDLNARVIPAVSVSLFIGKLVSVRPNVSTNIGSGVYRFGIIKHHKKDILPAFYSSEIFININ